MEKQNNEILNLIKAIGNFTSESLNTKTVQKMVYLIQQAGEDLDFDYSIYFHGPYSADLDYEIYRLYHYGDLNILMQQERLVAIKT